MHISTIVLLASLPVAFPPGDVKVGGEIGRRMDSTVRKMLDHTDVEKTFTSHFRHRKETPDEPGGFAGYGMYLDALVKAAAHGIGGGRTVAVKKRLLAELSELQSPDGQVTMFSGRPGRWDAHENAYMIQALAEDFRRFGTPTSLETARRLADSLIQRNAEMSLGSETAFIRLYEESGERRYLDWTREKFRIEADMDAYDGIVGVNGAQHVYTWLARSLSQMQYADAVNAQGAARKSLLASASEAVRRACCGYMSISGSMSGQPHWGELWDNSQVGLGKWGETCASAYMMRLLAKMADETGEARCGDLYERILYNAFFSAQSADGLKYKYWTPFNESAPWYDRDTYCCPNNFKRMVFEVPDFVFSRRQDGLDVNLYAEATLDSGDVFVKMETEYPDDGKVRLFVKMPGSTLRLRVPSWCRGMPSSNGWLVVTRDFSKGADLAVEFPMHVRLVRGTRAQEGRVAVMRGPCVFGLDPAANGISMQNADVWDVDASKPMSWDADDKAVIATFACRNRKRQEKAVRLHRYSSDGRERTFFMLRGCGATVEDELAGPLACETAVADFSRISEMVRIRSEQGGGRVTVPPGVYLSHGPITLRSNVELHLSEGANVVFPDDPADYLPEVRTSHEGVEGNGLSPLVYAYGCTNVSVTGSGTLTARTDGWRNMVGTSLRRPPFLQFNRCRNVRVEGVRIRRSPFWTIHLFRSDDVVVRDVDIEAFDANNDAIDVDMSRNVLVEGCRLFAGDDGIAVKSGRRTDDRRAFAPSENVIVRKCRVVSGHGMLSCGSELSGGIRNVLVEDCSGGALDNVLRVKTNRTRGGFVENVVMRNVSVDYAKTVFSISDKYDNGAESPVAETDETRIDGVELSGVMVRRARVGVHSSWSGERMPQGVVVKDLAVGEVTMAPFEFEGRECVRLENTRVPPERIPAEGVVFEKIASLDRYSANWPGFEKVAAFLRRGDLMALPPGRYPLDGEGIVAEVRDMRLSPLDEPRYERCPEGFSMVLYIPEGGEYVRFGDEGAFFNIWPDSFAVVHPGMRFAAGLTNRSPAVRRLVRVLVRNEDVRSKESMP